MVVSAAHQVECEFLVDRRGAIVGSIWSDCGLAAKHFAKGAWLVDGQVDWSRGRWRACDSDVRSPSAVKPKAATDSRLLCDKASTSDARAATLSHNNTKPLRFINNPHPPTQRLAQIPSQCGRPPPPSLNNKGENSRVRFA